jgi:NAD(P)-dependent dehydrogenase (short-subunit alcohol dehydrogenase family)
MAEQVAFMTGAESGIGATWAMGLAAANDIAGATFTNEDGLSLLLAEGA